MMDLWNNDAYQNELEAIKIPDDVWEKLYGKTILITGATGMVCSFLVDAIVKKNASLPEEKRINQILLIRNIGDAKKRFAQQTKMGNLLLEEADICENLEKIEEYHFDYIIAGAGNADPASFTDYPVDTMKSNFLGVYHLLELVRGREGCRVLYISSGEVYGNTYDDIESFKEDDSYYINSMDVRACYPNSKRAAETLSVSYAKQYGVDVIIGRLCYVYGATIKDSDSRSVAQFLRRAANGEDIILKSKGEQIRSYCYVADVIEAFLVLLVKGKVGEAYNIADKKSNCSIAEFANLVSQAAAVQCTYSEASIKEKAGYSTVARAVQCPDKILNLGWNAKTILSEGIKRTIKILRG